MGNAKSSEDETEKKTKNGQSPNKQVQNGRRTSKNFKASRASLSSQGSGTYRKPVIPAGQRQIVKGCMDNAKDDIGDRIYRRVYEKRDDFRTFVDSLSDDQKTEMVETLREFLQRVVEQLADTEEVQKLSEEFGAKHVQFRNLGFRPDFFAVTADAVTTECVFLDAAVHQSYETLTAWSTLTSMMFSSVRDGYYNELRKIRRASNVLSTMKTRSSLDTSTDGSSRGEDDHSRRGSRSISPMDSTGSVLKEEEAGDNSEVDSSHKSSNFLCPHELRGY